MNQASFPMLPMNNCRRSFSARSFFTAPMRLPARSSFKRPSGFSTSCSRADGRCATGSASAAKAFNGQGLLHITRKQEWPDWTPPPEMIERQPYLPRFMAGGPGNPMGARALYLGTTVYRIHGTNQPKTIGSAVSSGCFRLVNGDVIDLYDRIPVGTKVIVRQKPEM